jgi:hypothetical protein
MDKVKLISNIPTVLKFYSQKKRAFVWQKFDESLNK